ncbi:TetR/AcrR family transcriptional regulator [Pseudomaricurvus sp. HS19]|uniref:TetR/AcrR family transcriptional regulator n=1 Tax=Pseudomaricurvus sp. HS19 TaxID=2692626 RepID=UPI0019279C7D
MGVQDRKKRQFAEREALFLDRAWAMIERDGLLNLQMARLAAECEYAVGTLYLHFSCKEDLLVALATRTVGQRMELYERAALWSAPHRHRLLAILVAEVLYAQSAPENFRLVQYASTPAVWMAASAARREAALEASKPLGSLVLGVAAAAVADGDVSCSALQPHELTSGLWAMTEGMHVLVGAAGLLDAHSVPRPYQLLLVNAHALLNGLGWQPLIALDDEAAQKALAERIVLEVFPELAQAACDAQPQE